ncbi:unnamed protein product [Closterium sp. NIES-54]
MTMRPDIDFECSKLGSGLTMRSDQHWREVNRYPAYLGDTRAAVLEFGGQPESLTTPAMWTPTMPATSTYDHGRLWVRLRRGCRLLDEPAHQVRDTLVDRVGVRRGHRSRQGGTPNSFPPCRVLAVGRWDAEYPSCGQQVGHHGRRRLGAEGQPQAHGAAISLAAADGEAREVCTTVHPDHRAADRLPDEGAAISGLQTVLRGD